MLCFDLVVPQVIFLNLANQVIIAVFVLFCSSFTLEEFNTCNAIPFDMRRLYIEILREKI